MPVCPRSTQSFRRPVGITAGPQDDGLSDEVIANEFLDRLASLMTVTSSCATTRSAGFFHHFAHAVLRRSFLAPRTCDYAPAFSAGGLAGKSSADSASLENPKDFKRCIP